VIGYYSQLRPHTHNAGLTPKVADYAPVKSALELRFDPSQLRGSEYGYVRARVAKYARFGAEPNRRRYRP
jgi:hypothetical protein